MNTVALIGRPHAAAILAAGIGIFSAASAHAGVQYTNQSAFVSALTAGYYHETYQSYPFGGMSTPKNFAGGAGNAFTYTATTTSQAFLVFDLSGNNYLTNSGQFGTGWAGNMKFTFTGAPVYAIGGNFFYTLANGNITGGTVNLSFSDGTSVALTGQTNSTFFGYIGFSPIASLTITPDATHHFISVDNFYVGTSSVPTPAAAALLGVAGVVAGRRRRN